MARRFVFLMPLALLMLAAAAGCSSLALAGQTEDHAAAIAQATLSPERAAPGVRVHRLDLGVSKAYLLEYEEGLFLVDAGLPLTERLILDRIEELGGKELRLIYITHAHIDHYGAAAAVREATGAPIAVHRADAAAMAEGVTELGMVRDWEWTEDTFVPWVEDSLQIEPVEPDILLEDGDSLAEYGLDATVLHTPGHTPGSSSLIVEGTLAFVGDLLSANGKPHAQRMYAADWDQLEASIARLQELNVLWVYSGHGNEAISGETLRGLEASFADE